MWPKSAGLRATLTTVVLLFAFLSLTQTSQPYVIDEAEFPFVAQATAETGKPIYYHGELRPADVGIWHPPLYVYSLAGWMTVFGETTIAVRSFGVFFALLTAFIGMLICRRLFPANSDLMGVIFAAIYLLNPFTIASALIPDIDGTIAAFAIALTLLAAISAAVSDRARHWEVLTCGGALGFALSTKLTTPLSLLPFVGIAFLISRRSIWQAVRDSATSFAIGAAIFVGWWFPLSSIADLSFSFPFNFTKQSFNKGTAADQTLAETIRSAWPDKALFFWVTPLFFVVFAIGTVVALRVIRTKTGQVQTLLAAFAIGTIVLYDVVTGPVFTFPKYWIAATLSMTLVSILPLSLVLQKFSVLSLRFRFSGVLVGIGLFFLSIISAVVISRILAKKLPTNDFPRWPWPWVMLVVVSVAVLMFIAFRINTTGIARSAGVGLTSLTATLLVLNLATAMDLRSKKTSTRYYFGEKGFSEVVDEVQARTTPSQPILSPKDIGFAANRPFYEDALLLPNPDQLDQFLRDNQIALVVTRKYFDYSEPVFPAGFEVIRANFVPVFDEPTTDFVLWEPNPGDTAEPAPMSSQR